MTGGEGDRMTVRRDAERQAGFHYSREERLCRPGAPPPRTARRGGLFRSNRGLLILLLDVLLLALAITLLRAFGLFDTSRATVQGWEIELGALRVLEEAQCVLVVRRADSSAAEPAGRLFARFYGESTPEVYEAAAADLPRESGEEIALRATVRIRERERTLCAAVSLGEVSRILKRRIPE